MPEFIGATTDLAVAGLTHTRILAAATTNATLLKTVPGNLYGWYFENNAAYAAYVKVYDTATIPTAGAGTPLFTILVPAGGQSGPFEGAIGIPLVNGLGFTMTKLFADTDVTVLVAGDVQGFFLYK